MNAATLCNRNVVIAYPHESLIDAARRMLAFNVGTLIVVDEDDHERRRPIGILTDRDIVVGAIARHEDRAARLTVGDTMSDELHVAREQDALDEVLEMMRKNGVRRVPIVDAQGGLQGLLTLDDLLDWLAEELADITSVVVRQQPTI